MQDGQDYWSIPAELYIVLLRARPHLSTGLQIQLDAYLQAEYAAFSPANFAHIGWADGAWREPFDYAPTIDQNVAGLGPSPDRNFVGWSLPPQNVYAVWRYAAAGLGSPAPLFASIQSKLKAPITANQAVLTDEWLAHYPHVLNAYVAGYTGYVGLAQLAGQSAAAHQAELARLQVLRAAQLTTTVAPLASLNEIDRQYWWTLAHSWNWLYLVPELGDYLQANAPAAVAAIFSPANYASGAVAQVPFWMLAHNREVNGENGVSPYQQTHSIFQAMALVLDRPDMSRYLDAPVSQADLYYIDNLVAAIESAGMGLAPD
jgi:hypothetical protein